MMLAFEKTTRAIIFRRDESGEIKYLIVKHSVGGYWEFPGGLVEKGETNEEAALREINEEVGIKELTRLPNFKEKYRWFFTVEHDYQVKRGLKLGWKVMKTAHFFLFETKVSEVKLSFEHSDFRWLSYEEARKQLTYENYHKTLERAHKFLEKASLAKKEPVGVE